MTLPLLLLLLIIAGEVINVMDWSRRDGGRPQLVDGDDDDDIIVVVAVLTVSWVEVKLEGVEIYVLYLTGEDFVIVIILIFILIIVSFFVTSFISSDIL